ncbi:MAG: hypothetical protein AB1896_02995 [Thermodesulfobacteriota bacterium]
MRRFVSSFAFLAVFLALLPAAVPGQSGGPAVETGCGACHLEMEMKAGMVPAWALSPTLVEASPCPGLAAVRRETMFLESRLVSLAGPAALAGSRIARDLDRAVGGYRELEGRSTTEAAELRRFLDRRVFRPLVERDRRARLNLAETLAGGVLAMLLALTLVRVFRRTRVKRPPFSWPPSPAENEVQPAGEDVSGGRGEKDDNLLS